MKERERKHKQRQTLYNFVAQTDVKLISPPLDPPFSFLNFMTLIAAI